MDSIDPIYRQPSGDSLPSDVVDVTLKHGDPVRARRMRLGMWALALLAVGLVAGALINSFVLPRLTVRVEEADLDRVQADIDAIESGVMIYSMAHEGEFPLSLRQLLEKDEEGRVILPDYEAVPRDPWGNPYRYDSPAEGQRFRVYTFGSDNRPGGDGPDADIDNWNLGGELRAQAADQIEDQGR